MGARRVYRAPRLRAADLLGFALRACSLAASTFFAKSGQEKVTPKSATTRSREMTAAPISAISRVIFNCRNVGWSLGHPWLYRESESENIILDILGLLSIFTRFVHRGVSPETFCRYYGRPAGSLLTTAKASKARPEVKNPPRWSAERRARCHRRAPRLERLQVALRPLVCAVWIGWTPLGAPPPSQEGNSDDGVPGAAKQYGRRSVG
jgi:hypothetical protein